jgi:uncharacterized protein (TIGR03083 family)
MTPDHLLPDDDVVASYIALRARVVELLRALPPSDAGLTVPSCPDWTVAQLVGHLVGVPEDIITGNMEGVTTDAWTQAQADRHAGRSLAELADSYEATGTVLDEVLPRVAPPGNSQMVMDAVTHELDLREAVGDMGARESTAIDVALGWLRFAFEGRIGAATFAHLDAGDVDRYELLRSLTGRRTAAQIDALGLDADAIITGLSGTPLRPPL